MLKHTHDDVQSKYTNINSYSQTWRNILGEKKSDYLTYPACHFCTILPHPMDRSVLLTNSHCLIKSAKK